MNSEDLKNYEISYLLKNEGDLEIISSLISRLGGEVYMTEPLQRIELAYKIGRETSAYFGYMHFRMLPAEVKNLEHELTIGGTVIRFLIITPPTEKPKVRQMAPTERKESVEKPASVPMPESAGPLSNEALEKKIEEILQ